MTYNLSIGPVRRMRDYLDRLTQRETIRFATEDPRTLAYKLREACAASQKHDQFTQYHDLRELYQFEEKRNAVVARFIGSESPQVADESEPDDTEESSATPSPEEIVVTEAETLEGVIGAVLKMEDRADQLRFPNATLLDAKKEKLHRWTKGRDWKFIDQKEAGTTLTKREVPSEIIWSPEDEATTGD